MGISDEFVRFRSHHRTVFTTALLGSDQRYQSPANASNEPLLMPILKGVFLYQTRWPPLMNAVGAGTRQRLKRNALQDGIRRQRTKSNEPPLFAASCRMTGTLCVGAMFRRDVQEKSSSIPKILSQILLLCGKSIASTHREQCSN